MANFYTDNKDLHFHLNHPLMKKIVRLKENNYKDASEYDYAPADFEDAMDSYEKVLEIIGDISGNVIAENAESVDQEGAHHKGDRVYYAKGTQENHDKLAQAGVIGMSLPRKYDGLNFSMVPYVMAAEIVSRADAGFANIWGLQDCAETIHEFADEEIKQAFLPRFNKGETASMDLTEPDAGSDLQRVALKATYNEKDDTWYLNGVKRFITNGDAEIALVLARSEEGTHDGRGLSLFVHDKNDGGVKVRRIENKLGIKGSPTCELVFKDATAKLIGNRRLGLIKYVMSLMNGARLGVAAQSVGLAEAALREGEKYASERVQFGKTIIDFPAVYEMLANMRAKTHAARALLYETTRFVDVYKNYMYLSAERKLEPEERKEMKSYNRLADAYTPLAKLFGSEYCNEIAYDALQIHGGAGYMKDFPIERLYRDARITNIYEGTTQLQVVAAIRGVTTGLFTKQMEAYAAEKYPGQYNAQLDVLKDLKDAYEKAFKWVDEQNDNIEDNNDFFDFHARRLVEMAGNIIMTYLLLKDSIRDNKYYHPANLFLNMAKSENAKHLDMIYSVDYEEMLKYKA
ncbi:MAG: acyl-CoA dehydrogenase family protein [Candidatus Delongbacteria bacterium]|jgi:alkylation response protein AidB-like acyl-CoA dehydrogenase|nr:acyl-CoA dehydrogenase family protein [Candidatus Delongbacteria bacterium]